MAVEGEEVEGGTGERAGVGGGLEGEVGKERWVGVADADIGSNCVRTSVVGPPAVWMFKVGSGLETSLLFLLSSSSAAAAAAAAS